jgi:hypothetical protein
VREQLRIDGMIEERLRLVVERQKPEHLRARFRIAAAGVVQIGGPRRGFDERRLVEHRAQAAMAVERRAHARILVHCTWQARRGTERTDIR